MTETAAPIANETRFRRVAGSRANAALHQLERLTHTADRRRYTYTDEQAAEIVGKLRQALDRLEAAYNGADQLRIEL
jgi:hypothetical protein